MFSLNIPPPARIAIGTAQVGGQRVEIFMNAEWARYFERLTNQVVSSANQSAGAAPGGMSLSDDSSAGAVEFIPRVGEQGPKGEPGPALFGLQDECETPYIIPGPKGDQGQQGDPGPALFLMQDDSGTEFLPAQPTQRDEAFIAPTLLNSWVNYDTVNFNSAGYFKDADGIVHLRGMLKSGVVALSSFSLPAGYRPSKAETFATNSNDTLGRVVIDAATGDVTLAVGSNVFFTLDGITFRAAGTF